MARPMPVTAPVIAATFPASNVVIVAAGCDGVIDEALVSRSKLRDQENVLEEGEGFVFSSKSCSSRFASLP